MNGNQKTLYAGIIITSIFFFTQIQEIKIGHFFAILIATSLIYYLNDRELNDTSTFNQTLMNKLNALGNNYNYLYLDPDMIQLFYSIKDDFGQLNADTYNSALRSVDNLLRIRSDFETVNILDNSYETFQIAEAQGKAAMNYTHSFIHSISDNKVLYNKHQHLLKRLQLLIQRNLDYMKTKLNNEPLSVKSRFVTDYNGPVALDKAKGTGLADELFNFY